MREVPAAEARSALKERRLRWASRLLLGGPRTIRAAASYVRRPRCPHTHPGVENRLASRHERRLDGLAGAGAGQEPRNAITRAPIAMPQRARVDQIARYRSLRAKRSRRRAA